jgi:AcrR family transcriptional regulator
MPSVPQPPTGAARRRRRISDAETERRMLDAAVRMITESGMTVSLDHLSMEEIIHAAGVARTSVYRRWPYKDLFVSDVLIEVARATALGSGYGPVSAVLVDHLAGALPRPEDVEPQQDRRDFVVELLRVAALADFDAVHPSQQWRTYIALHATHLGLPDGDLRREIGLALAQSEQRFGASRAANFRLLADLAGYRLVGDFVDPDDGFGQMSLAIGSTVTGLAVKAFADPELVHDRRLRAPFGTSRAAEWSTPALVLVRVTLSYIEPDPDIPWDEDRVRYVIEGAHSLAAEA